MRAKQIAVRAALVLGAAGAGVALWSAAAHAADHRPASVDQVLPDQATDRAREAVDQVLPHNPAEPRHEAPQREEPANPPPAAPEPTQPTADPIVELPPIEVPPVVEVPPAPVPVVVEPPPVVEPAPVVLTPPSADPAPLPDAGDLLPVQVLAAPRLPLVAPLPLIGPVHAAAPLTDARHGHHAPEVGPPGVAVCNDDTQADPLDMAAPAHRIKRIHPHVVHLAAPGRTPCDPGGQDLAHLASVTALSQSGGGQLAATLPAATFYPALRLLRELRPRGDIPATRSLHIDPRPA